MEKNLVSIVVPVYNKGIYISKCMDSLINQTFKDIEIICVNDGSTDNSLAVLESYAQNDNRIKIINQKNQGVSAARNTGIKYIQGEYTLFVDPDDYIRHDAVEILFKTAKKRNCEVLLFGRYNFTENTCKLFDNISHLANKIKDINIKFEDYYIDLFNISITVWDKLYKTSLIKENNILFPVELSCAEDVCFGFESYVNANSISLLNEHLYFYRENAYNSLTKASGPNLIYCYKAHLIMKNILFSSKKIKNKEEIYKALLSYDQKGVLWFWRSQYNVERNISLYKYLQLFEKEYKPFLKDKNFCRKRYNVLKKEMSDYKYFCLKKILEPIFELEKRTFRTVIYLFGHQIFNCKTNARHKKEDKKMDFEKFFKVYNAQEKINKLAKKYKNRRIVLYGAGQFAQILFENYDLSKLNIVGICDKKFEKEENKNFYGLNCIAPIDLYDYDCDLILISNFDYKLFANIVDELLYGSKNDSLEVRPLIRLSFLDLLTKKFY